MSNITLPSKEEQMIIYETQTQFLPHPTYYRITERAPYYIHQTRIFEEKIDILKNEFLWVPLNEFIVHDKITPIEIRKRETHQAIEVHDKKEKARKKFKDLRKSDLFDMPEYEAYGSKP